MQKAYMVIISSAGVRERRKGVEVRRASKRGLSLRKSFKARCGCASQKNIF